MHSLQHHTVSVSAPTPARERVGSAPSLLTLDAPCVQEPAHAGVVRVLHAGGMQLCWRYKRPSLLAAVDVEEFMHLVFWAKTELAVICDQEGTWSRVSTVARFWLLSIVFVVAVIVCVSTRSIELLRPCRGPSGSLEKLDLGSNSQPVLDRADDASQLLPRPGFLRSLRRPIVAGVWH